MKLDVEGLTLAIRRNDLPGGGRPGGGRNGFSRLIGVNSV